MGVNDTPPLKKKTLFRQVSYFALPATPSGKFKLTQTFTENLINFTTILTLLLTSVQTEELFYCLLLEIFLSPTVTIVNPV